MVVSHAPIEDASVSQQKTVAIVPKITSALSFLGSLYIVVDVLRMQRSQRRIYHRILLGMNISACLSSLAWFCTTWPIPPDVLPIWGAKGTQQTCSAQGFFSQTHIAAVMYSGWLTFYYFLVLQLGWTQSQLEKSKMEWAVHGSAVIFALTTSIVALSLGLFNPEGWACWIESLPPDCKESWEKFQSSGAKCTRGDNSILYQWAFFYVPLWLVILGTTIIMTSIFLKFWKQEKRNQKWRSGYGKSKRVKEMFWQCIFYVGSFYAIWLFPTILRISEAINGGELIFTLVMLSATFLTSHGIFHIIVYLRPQYIQVREQRRKIKLQQKRQESLDVKSNDGHLSGSKEGSAVKPISDEPSSISALHPSNEEAPQERTKLRTVFAWKLTSMVQRVHQTLWRGDEGLGGIVDSRVEVSHAADHAVDQDDTPSTEQLRPARD